MKKIAISFLLLSGIASLSYQLVWVRLLGLSMGSTSASISTVLAAFFLGLAIGSYFAERFTRNRIDSLKPYIFLELIIGVAGLLLLPTLLHLDLLMAVLPSLVNNIPLKFIITMFLLAVPTICMGATFPVMASILVRQEKSMASEMSLLYSVNTVGAVFGAALAGFVFIPRWGLDGAVYIAFTLNMLIAVVAIFINKKITLNPVETSMILAEEEIESVPDEKPNLGNRALIILFVTGFVSIAAEVGWTKYLSIFTGTTIYGFAAILTVFLTGIAAGSWFIKLFISNMKSPALWMSTTLILLGSTLLLTRVGLTFVPELYLEINQMDVTGWSRNITKYAVVFAILFLPTFMFGVIFPINLKLYCGNLQGVRSGIGKAYAVNTLASIFGAVLAGFWIIPAYGTDILLVVLAMVVLVLPLLFVPAIQYRKIQVVLVSIIIFTMVLNLLLPRIDYKNLINAVQYDDYARRGIKPRYVFLQEGKAGIISMVTYDETVMVLQNNGLKESKINIKNPDDVLLIESLLGLIPYFIHENSKSAFVIGFGGGITTQALTYTPLDSIRVVELEPAVIEAGRSIVNGEIPALKDPRVSIEFNDARNTLLTDSKQYDIIVSQPSHPWLAGAATVFTRNFFSLVKSRLNEEGIYGQWVNLFHMDATTLKSLFKAFYQVFPYGVTFGDLVTGDFLMFGSKQAVRFNLEEIDDKLQRDGIRQIMGRHKITNARDLFYYFSLSREQALKSAGDVPANTDLNILSEVRLSAIDGTPPKEESPYTFIQSEYTFNAGSYFEKNAAQEIYDLGYYYLMKRGEVLIAKFAANELSALDADLSRKLWNKIQALEKNASHKL